MLGCCVLFLLSLVTLGQGLPQQPVQNALREVARSLLYVNQTVKTQGQTSNTGDALICLLCINVVQQGVKAISSPDMQQRMEANFEKSLCAVFKDKYGNVCRHRIKTYAPLIFQIITKNLDSETFCEDISLCTQAPFPPPESHWLADLMQSAAVRSSAASSPQVAGQGMACDVCLFFVHTVVDQIGSEVAEEKVDGFVQKVCRVFPIALRQTCGSYVHRLVVTVIEMATSDLIQPSEICRLFNFCSSDGKNGLLQGETVRAGQDSQQVTEGDHPLHFQPSAHN